MFIFRSVCAIAIEVKLSLYRLGQALRVPGVWGFQDFQKIGTWRWQDCQAHAPAAFIPTEDPWHSLPLEAESTPELRPEGSSQWKIPMTPSGIENATFRPAAQDTKTYMNWQLCKRCVVVLTADNDKYCHVTIIYRIRLLLACLPCLQNISCILQTTLFPQHEQIFTTRYERRTKQAGDLTSATDADRRVWRAAAAADACDVVRRPHWDPKRSWNAGLAVTAHSAAADTCSGSGDTTKKFLEIQ